jgi:CheY-like chemotaxis protein
VRRQSVLPVLPVAPAIFSPGRATFRNATGVILPTAREQLTVPLASFAPLRKTSPMPHVLVIEDNEFNQDLLARYLSLFGYEVELAGTGSQGLELAAEGDFVAVLLDMNLPDVDGWEIARRLKGDPRTASLPVIAVTAHAMVGDREKVLAAGCDDYVTKPIDFTTLLQKLHALAPKPELV